MFLVHILAQHHLIEAFLEPLLSFRIHFHLLGKVHNIPLVLPFYILLMACPQDYHLKLLCLLHVCLIDFLYLLQYIQLLLLLFHLQAYMIQVQNIQLLQLYILCLLPLVLFRLLLLLFHPLLLHMLLLLCNCRSMSQILNKLFLHFHHLLVKASLLQFFLKLLLHLIPILLIYMVHLLPVFLLYLQSLVLLRLVLRLVNLFYL